MENIFEFLAQEWMLVSAIVVLFYVYTWREANKAGKPLSASRVTQMINSGDAVLVDVRDSAEYTGGHIASSLNIPFTKLSEQLDQLDQYRDKSIVVADKMGQHAAAAGRLLAQQGFSVFRLQGGVAEWQNQRLPLIKA